MRAGHGRAGSPAPGGPGDDHALSCGHLVVVCDGVGSCPDAALIARAAAGHVLRRLTGTRVGPTDLLDLPARVAADLLGDRLHPGAQTCLAVGVAGPDQVVYLTAVGDCRITLFRRHLGRWRPVASAGGTRTAGAPTSALRPGQVVTVRGGPEVVCARLDGPGLLLATSDGVHEVVDDATVAELITRTSSPAELCRRLVARAGADAGTDDRTAAALFLTGLRAHSASRPAGLLPG